MSTPELVIGGATAPRIGRRTRMRRRFLRRPMAVTGLVLAVLFTLMAILAPLIAPYGPGETDFAAPLAGPSADHLLGTDELGRDTLSRIIYGARASMQVGLLSTALAMLVGVPLGLISGYFRGWSDPVISRITDVLLAFPFIVLAVGLAAIFGPSLTNATIALGFAAMPGIVRVTRGETLALREEDYVRAAIANGAGDATILRRHILPNLDQHAARAGDGDDPAGDPRRGAAVVPRARRAAADAVVGRDALGRAAAAQPGADAGGLAGHRGGAGHARLQPARRRAA